MRAMLAGLLATSLSGCAVQPARPVLAGTSCDAKSIESAPGKAWWREQRWRYPSDEAATAAYLSLLDQTPAWPDWFVPASGTLSAGTRVQMALSPGQPETKPGGFATFDNIFDAGEVRQYLAVREAWKPKVDRVVTYEVTQDLPVQLGPVGPQIDPQLCVMLPGRWSQAKMLVPDTQRMEYLRVIAVREIR
ncbi:MAG: hypothetical protein EOP62_03755 [Sphingomonadales bacterium]|nr:MAG: hypothetical protein EOP62_03755 [Sphingomonadales bacterium]